MSTSARWSSGLCLLAVAVAASWWLAGRPSVDRPSEPGDAEVVERTEYRRPTPESDDRVVDDRLGDKATAFDPAFVDPRPLGDWLVNASDAVIRLDTPMLRPDLDATLFEIRPSYKAAAEAARANGDGAYSLLPSVSMIDGKAKQFDDGLYAAIDLAYYRGLEGRLAGHVALVRRLFEKVGPSSPAAPYLAAALAVAGVDVKVGDEAARSAWLARFESDPARSRPTGFYTWSRDLEACFRFLRFGQGHLPRGETAVARALADALKADPALLADYKTMVDFYARLTNPSRGISFADLAEGREKIGTDRNVSLFPNATSRETELFTRLFPQGLPPDAKLMRSMIAKIRSGEVSLRPGPEAGWYDYQVYALETLLLPDKGEEKDKLLLTRAYKERMVDAFKAMMTKRRETHVRSLEAPAGSAMPPTRVDPRLRLEPSPTYYLRTARAYGFLATFLESAVGLPALKGLHGLKEGGERPLDLHTELLATRDLFYGFYLLSAEDIGLKSHFLDGEPVDRARSAKAAADWLARPFDDPDLAVDTRVSVPIYFDYDRSATRLWTTLGVRLAKLDARYVRGPRIRPKEGPGEWKEPDAHLQGTAIYLIPVDEFAEVEIRGVRTLTRGELRATCDARKTKEAILGALRSSP